MICARRHSLKNASNIANLPPLRDVIARYGLAAKKSLGQNFLLDLNLTARIARAAGNLDGINVIEIGPGPGGLTRALLDTDAKHVYAIERDSRCVEALQEMLGENPHFTLTEGDALETDPASLTPTPRAIVANLPYNIATPLLIGWLKKASDYQSMTLMFQREVAERLTATPGSKAYGRLSVIAQWCANVERQFDIPPSAFTPPPKVTSTVVRFAPHANQPDAALFRAMENVTAAAFGQRRKMLRQSLKALTPNAEALLQEAELLPTARAEEIDISGFDRLAKLWLKKGTRP